MPDSTCLSPAQGPVMSTFSSRYREQLITPASPSQKGKKHLTTMQ